MNIWQIN